MPMMEQMTKLSKRQEEVLMFINLYRRHEQCNPTCAEISQAFDWRSANAAHDILVALERKGAIEYRRGQKSRGYRVLNSYEKFMPKAAHA